MKTSQNSIFPAAALICAIAILPALLTGCVIEPFAESIPLPRQPAPASYAPESAWTGPSTLPSNPATSVTTGQIIPQTAPLASPVTIDATTRDQIARRTREIILNRYPPANNAPLNDYLVLVTSLITIASPASTPESDFQCILLESDRPFSAALGPKTILLSRGLLQVMTDESELAGLLAREIANLQSNRPFRAIGYLVAEPAPVAPIPQPTPATTLPTTRPTATTRPARVQSTTPATHSSLPPVALSESTIQQAAQKLADLLLTDTLGPDLDPIADLEGARLAAAAKYAPDGYLHLLTRLKPVTSNSPEWSRIKSLDLNVAIISKANPSADMKLPARFEGYVKAAGGKR